MDKLNEVCKKHNLTLIEDCAQAHGAKYHGQRVGSFGIGTFSFYPTKNMTCGEGGAVTTNNFEIAESVKLLRNHGQSEKYLHTGIGYNLRMTDIAAAIGVGQLERIEQMNNTRRNNAKYLTENLSNIKGIVPPKVQEDIVHVYHQYVIAVSPEFKLTRDELMKFLREKEIGCTVHYPLPITSQPYYTSLGYTSDCKNSSVASKEVLSLPVVSGLTKEQLDFVIASIKEAGE